MANFLNGNDLQLFKDGSALALVTNTSFSMAADTEQITTKDSGHSPKTLSNGYTWTITSDSLIPKNLGSIIELRNALAHGTELDVIFGTVTEDTSKGLTTEGGDQTKWTSGTTIADGKAIITQLDINGEAGSNGTYTVTLQGSGAITDIPAETPTPGE